MTARTPIEAAEEYVAAYNARSVERLLDLYDPGFHAENPLWEGSKSVDQTLATIQRVWDTLPGSRMEITRLTEIDDIVVLEMLLGWEDPRTGTPVSAYTPVADIFTVREGRLVELRAYMDAGTFETWLNAMSVA